MAKVKKSLGDDVLSICNFILNGIYWIVSSGHAISLVASLVAQMGKNPPAVQETQVQSLGQEDPLEGEMATHSSLLAWRIPWTEEPGRLQSMGSQSQTWLSDYHSTRNGHVILIVTRKQLVVV